MTAREKKKAKLGAEQKAVMIRRERKKRIMEKKAQTSEKSLDSFSRKR